MAEYRERHQELSALGASVVALSVDPPQRSHALARQLRLPFLLLSDPSRQAVTAYGLLNESKKGGIAYPATFVLTPDLTVLFRSLDRTASRVNLDSLVSFLRDGAQPTHDTHSRVVPRAGDFLRVSANAIRHGIVSPRG